MQLSEICGVGRDKGGNVFEIILECLRTFWSFYMGNAIYGGTVKRGCWLAQPML